MSKKRSRASAGLWGVVTKSSNRCTVSVLAVCVVILLCSVSDVLLADDEDRFVTVPLAVPVGTKCAIQKRLITVSCGIDDWCTVTDTLHLAKTAECGEDWRMEVNRKSQSFTTPQLAVRATGQPTIQVGAAACSAADPYGWCFAGVPPAERMRFLFKVRATNVAGEQWPGMAMRHVLLSKQLERATSRKGFVLSLAPNAWERTPPTQVTAKGNALHQYELVGRNYRGSETLTTLDVSDRPSGAAIVAKKSGDYGEDVRVRITTPAPFADVAYEQRGSLGFAGLGADVSLESPTRGDPTIAGGIFGEAWLLSSFGFALGVEGSSAGRVGIRTDALFLTKAPVPSSVLSMPSFGASVGVVTDVTPAVAATFRLRALVQLQWVGAHVGVDFPGNDAPTRFVVGASFSL